MTKELDTYQGLCTEYYELDKPIAPQEELTFYMQYAKGCTLEPMCGSGRFLLAFLEAGFEIEGFDASQYMLDALLKKSQLLKPKIWRGFLEDLAEQEKYDLVFIPAGSYNLLTEDKQIKLCLKKIYNSLLEGGVFVFEFITKNLANISDQKQMRSSFLTRPDSLKIKMRILNFPVTDSIGRSIHNYELVDANKILRSETEIYHIRYYDFEELELLLKEAGFSGIKKIKCFNRQKEPDEEDETIIYECTK